ncbi:MAG: enoyl-CoA hydratase-related protein [Oceanospirillaceae bacterium]|jgi:methylglutaconyl-CoA hydratase|nr:enoyl-CoA hydratase-related protein [Oceanospirillaceae bacterium]
MTSNTATNNTHVLCTVSEQGIATLTLNRPEKHNAFDDHIIAQLIDHLRVLAAQDELRALIITGTGKSFSAGADLAWMQRMADYDKAQNLADANQLAQLMVLLDSFPKPTLALVNGAAFGGAVGLMACCDSVICQDQANFCLSEVRIGLIPAVISPFVLNKVGPSLSRHLMTSAAVFNASQATSYGLVHQVVSLEQLQQAKSAWINQTLGNSPEAVAHIKILLAQFNTASPLAKENLANTQESTTEAIAAIRVSTNGQAGLKAFLDKTAAPWRT